MNLLVTGAAGFIGSNFVRFVLEQAPETKITVLDALRYSGNLSTIQDVWDRIHFVHGEIQNSLLISETLRQNNISHVVNFAAESHNDRSLLDNSNFIQTNTFGVHVLLEQSRLASVEKIVQVSTDEVYGSIETGEFTEASPIKPNTPYSASKAGGDLLCRAHWTSFQTPVVVTRGGNTYGPFHYPEKLIPFFLVRLIQKKKVPLYGEGTQFREWIHARDHSSGIFTALTKGEVGQIYNIGDKNERQNRVIVGKLLSALGLSEDFVKFIPDPRKGAHDQRYSMNTTKIESLGWTPTMNFEASLEATIQWFVDNEDWWRPIINDAGYQKFLQSFYGASLGEDL